MFNIEEIKIKIIKNGKIYNKLEKTYYSSGRPKQFFIIDENNKDKICAKHFRDYYVECEECHKLVNMKGNVLSVIYKDKYLCAKCRNTGERNGMFGKNLSSETRKKLSEHQKQHPSFKGRHHTEESKKLISKANEGRLIGEKNPMYGINVYELILQRDGVERVNEMKNKLSNRMKGENNPFYGKHHTEKTKEILRQYCKSEKFLELQKSEEYRRKLIEGMLNSQKLKDSRASKEYKEKLKKALENSEAYRAYQEYRKTPEYRELRRKQTAEQIIRNLELLGKNDGRRHFVPNFNVKACEFFDKLMKENGTNIQHALNGGEFGIPELGYFVDGYDKENNIVYEFDEAYHRTEKQKEKDKIREDKIKEFLKCKFIRINENEIDRN